MQTSQRRCMDSRTHSNWAGVVPTHFSTDVRGYLDRIYPHSWIGRYGPVTWAPRSPDINPMDFFQWRYMKSRVYDTRVTSDFDLVARIVEAVARVRDTPDQFERVRGSMYRRCEVCIVVGGRNFEHFL
ncbi:hypothetical protein AVEN_27977-1 [Araneus ventricosus]|uniref:Tc1-like transposase DDE domain-containing protein n=1 Tax=Araneus ventricosus TaxID=182803 RepID=A0A4Y2BFW0_ARAVE|nr:hypothetical protein AVEN_27977-1 [Araneus ventricosus]